MSQLPDYGSAIPAPPGVTPHPGLQARSLQRIWLGACVVMVAVPTILVALRLYIRYSISKQWKIADATCMIAWCFMVSLLSIALTLLNFGVGDDAWNLSPAEYSHFAKRLNIHQIVYMPAIFFAKAAILLQLYQIFGHTTEKYRRYALIGLIVFNAMFFTALMFIEIFECIPRPRIWNHGIPGHCINIQQTFIATGAINVADDLLMLALPVSWVWQLRMSSSKKVGVTAVFAAGIFGCACSIMRLIESVINVNKVDITHALMPVALWATAEVSVGVALACLPVLPALFRASRSTTSKIVAQYADPKNHVPVMPMGHRGKLISDESLLLSNSTMPTTQTHIGTLSSISESEKSSGFSQHYQEHGSPNSPRAGNGGGAPGKPEPAILRNITIDQTSQDA